MAVLRRPVRSRPIRLFLISMFAIPLVSLVGLWVFAVSVTVPEAISDHNLNVSTAAVDTEGKALAVELPTERAQTYLWLLSGRRAPKASLLATRELVNKAIPPALAAMRTEDGLLSAGPQAELNAFFTDLGQIGAIRAAVDAGTLSPTAAFQAYSNIIDTQLHSFEASDQDNKGGDADRDLGRRHPGGLRGRDGQPGGHAGGRRAGRPRPDERRCPSAVQRRRQQPARVLQRGRGAAAAKSRVRVRGHRRLAVLPALPGHGRPDRRQHGQWPAAGECRAWESVSGAYLSSLQRAEYKVAAQLAALGAARSSGLVTEAALAGGVGLVAVVASVFLVIWFGRKVTGDLTRLDGSVRAMAEERLPRVVERLRRGEDVDVLAESPPPAASGIREVSQIATSFATVQEAAVAAAVEQARLRRGINKVFLNISLRNQSLLHRQLGMLDGMERRTSDPAALADLFRLDHLTTRMRRHAEGLIIMSGATPGRGWRDPVPVVDVLRAAIAEVEDYVRVDVVSESPDLVAGIAVNDIIHLVAELVENATVFSPPNTRIEIRADRVGTGLVAEVEDRGLGMSPDEIDDINRLLANPSEFDLVNSEKLGLFVVSSLAARHTINVSLRRSAYGGTTAIVLLPFGVIVRAEEDGSPAFGHSGGVQGLRPDLGGLGPESRSPGTHDWSPFGVTGRTGWPRPRPGGGWTPARTRASRTRNGPRPPGPHRGRPGNTSRPRQPRSPAPPSGRRSRCHHGTPWRHPVAAAGPAGRDPASRAASGGSGWPERQAALAGPRVRGSQAHRGHAPRDAHPCPPDQPGTAVAAR